MVMADMAGRYEAPIYGLLAVDKAVEAYDWAGHGLTKPTILMHGQPDDESRPSILWDGEWEITWVTFRDMGASWWRCWRSMCWWLGSSAALNCRW
jgi:hypothetical protein